MPALSAVSRTAATLCILSLLAGCATTGANPIDPYEPANRKIYAFNDAVDRAALKPVAQRYERNVPKWVRASVSNFFNNLGTPVTIVNQLLQGKLQGAGQSTLRFAMNTTLGIGGLFDPATDARLPRHEEDLGQTLGVWGVPPGPYVMIPLLGPSHVRDLPSRVFNRFLEPFYWYDYGNERWFSLGLSIVDLRARLLPLDATISRAYDPYGFIRDAYHQRRLFQVYDGEVPPELLPQDDDDFEDDFEDEPEDPSGPDQAGAGSDTEPVPRPD